MVVPSAKFTLSIAEWAQGRLQARVGFFDTSAVLSAGKLKTGGIYKRGSAFCNLRFDNVLRPSYTEYLWVKKK